jgi:hypothetical protein
MLAVAVCSVAAVALSSRPVHAQDAPPPTSAPPAPVAESESGVVGGAGAQPPVTLPLVPVPPGCSAPALPHVVFVGEVVERDYRSARFEVQQIRAGRTEPFGSGNLIDVRYGLDAQYLDVGARYLVSAPVSPELGFLVSRVTDPIEDFGGDEVIGVSESDVACPPFEDPMRTLEVDGTPIEADLLEPFLASKGRILGAVLVPLGVGVGAIFVLAMLRLSVSGLAQSIAGANRRRV